MDYLAIIEGHLGFIEHFYNAAAEPFETTLRKIQSNEEPFVPRYAPGDYDGYEYQTEYNEAHDCLSVLGNCSLGLLEKALHDYLRAFVEREGGPRPRNRRSRGLVVTVASWKKIHRFAGRTRLSPKIRSNKSFSAATIHHDPMIDRTRPRQSKEHVRKHPVSRFAEGWEVEAMSGRKVNLNFP